ncbi:MAG: LPS export ABC transporter permease LptF [Kordiimonadaceae bacterium]|jgi:lipopolysaccharide export system permease protein|nr:LPS export ABC transporter permease LptF [Gammaproteobacteria bacterium]MBT5074135.1 LPS export ABC transporter permease LptF [Kordiimonadaceae bacterium]MBT6035818.1 LPS export ABC transporter permease LptF [Kordiimonadaceae bacterium]MBT6329170.1 LPS export ABC transporter permease LptF [Kordiimonadaceae bacterium]
MFKKIDFYILKNTIVPLFATLGISALLLLLEKMLSLFDFVINQGGPIDIVWQMLGNLMPQYLTLVIPLAMFLGVLLSIRKLALSSELDALFSCGMSLHRLLVPSIAIAVFLLIINVIVVGFVQPYSLYAYEELIFDVRSGALGAAIKSNEFTNLGEGLTLRIEESQDSGRELLDIFAQKEDADGHIFSVSAKRGSFFASPDQKYIILRLFDGTLIDFDASQNRPRILNFDMHDLPLEVPMFEQFRNRGNEASEMTFNELWQKRNDNDTTINATLHSRAARALSILIVPFLAVPLGLVAKRSGRALGISVGVFILLLYHKVIEFGLDFASDGSLSPYMSIWFPTVIFIMLTARLYYIGAYKVGGMPLRNLEIISDIIVEAIAKIFRRIRAAN